MSLFNGFLTALVGSSTVTEPSVKAQPPKAEAVKIKLLTKEEKELAEINEQKAKETECAKILEAEILAETDKLEAKLREEQERQKNGYSFSCHRFGQFLTVNMRRLGNIPYAYYGQELDAPQECSFTINLNIVRTISLEKGHEVDREGTVAYCHSRSRGVHRETFGEGLPSFRQFCWSGEKEASPRYSGCDCYDYSRRIDHVTTGYPRMAKDDSIVFKGAKVVLYVPAGLGEAVYQQILCAKEA